jgi:hypothetical protein
MHFTSLMVAALLRFALSHAGTDPLEIISPFDLVVIPAEKVSLCNINISIHTDALFDCKPLQQGYPIAAFGCIPLQST